MNGPLNQMAALANMQSAQLAVLSGGEFGFTAGAIRQMGTTWVFPVSWGGQTLLTVSRDWNNERYSVESILGGDTYGCDTPHQVVDAVRHIYDEAMLPQRIEEAKANLQALTGENDQPQERGGYETVPSDTARTYPGRLTDEGW